MRVRVRLPREIMPIATYPQAQGHGRPDLELGQRRRPAAWPARRGRTDRDAQRCSQRTTPCWTWSAVRTARALRLTASWDPKSLHASPELWFRPRPGGDGSRESSEAGSRRSPSPVPSGPWTPGTTVARTSTGKPDVVAQRRNRKPSRLRDEPNSGHQQESSLTSACRFSRKLREVSTVRGDWYARTDD
jgi:hypothetical protein